MRTLKILFVLAFVSCIGAPTSEDEGTAAGVAENKLKVRIRPDGTPSYDVLFTNPDCGIRDANEVVTGPYALARQPNTVGGGTRTNAVQGAYCFPQRDSRPSGARPTSPLYRLLSWINGTNNGDTIFAAYFSFSNKNVKDALIAAAGRGVKITFVKDSGQDNSVADLVAAAGPNVTIVQRGNENDIGYHHNKFFVVNALETGPADASDPDGTKYMKLAFSSGNMSSGTVLHQENWHFMEVARNSYFAQSHACVVNGLLDTSEPLAYAKRRAFTEHMDTCRAAITAAPETDISAFFIPSRTDSSNLRDRFTGAIAHASSVDVAAHRFSLFYLQQGLRKRLTDDPNFTARLVADDDLYWLRPMPPARSEDLGDNMPFELSNVIKLIQAGGGFSSTELGRFEARYVETNGEAHLLHHNKFVIARGRDDGQPDTVICGAANFTNDAFWAGSDSAKNNFENVYVIQIPHIVEAMERQFDGFWGAQNQSGAPVASAVVNLATCELESGESECAAYTPAVEP